MGKTNDKLERSPPRATDPYVGAVAINFAGGDQAFTQNPRALLLSTAGTLKVDFIDGSTATLILPANVMLPLAITKIYQTGSASAVGFVYL